MSQEIEEGSIVTLISGGPQMTVGRLHKDADRTPMAECFWYEPPAGQERGDVRFLSFPLATLRSVGR